MSFAIQALPMTPFAYLFELPADELEALNARRCTADRSPGYPCRVSLRDAAPGEALVLCRFEHQPGGGPYRGSGPVFVRRDAEQARPASGQVPDLLRSRMLSVRAYDSRHDLVRAEAADGARVEAAIKRALEFDEVMYLHLHFAGPGCYACRVERA